MLGVEIKLPFSSVYRKYYNAVFTLTGYQRVRSPKNVTKLYYREVSGT